MSHQDAGRKYAVHKPVVQNMYKHCRSRKYIQWYIPVHAIFAIFYLLFLPVLSRPSFTYRDSKQRPEDRETLLHVHSAHSSPITRRHSWAPWRPLLCMILASDHKKCLTQKVARFGSLEWIPMIQEPFNSSCVALQYKTGMKFFHRVVPELHGIKNRKISVQPCGILHVFSKFCRVPDDLSSTCQGGECSL